MLLMWGIQYASKFGKLSSGHRAGKGQFSFQYKKCSDYCTVELISHASKAMLKTLQPRLKQYVNQKLPDGQAGFRKGRGIRDKIVNIHWIIETAREFQKKTSTSVSLTKVFDCVDHNKLWKILKELGILKGCCYEP